MLKKINKYTKLAILFTVVWFLVSILIGSHFYAGLMDNKWIPAFAHKNLAVFYVFNFFPNWIVYFVGYLGSVIVAVVCGVIAFKQTSATERTMKWAVAVLALFNIIVLVINLVGVASR